MNRVLLLTALVQEAKAAARALQLHRRSPLLYEGDGITLHVIGIRASLLPALDIPNPQTVILAGVAGGLSPELQTGDVVIDGHPAIPGARSGKIHTASHVIGSTHEKASLFSDTHALAVDMEAAPARRRFPGLIHVRAIVDPHWRALDPALMTIVNDVGRVRPLALLGLLLRRPWLIGTLPWLAKANQRACKAMAAAVKTLVDQTSNA